MTDPIVTGPKRIFLDTTIQIERITATRARQAEITQNLSGMQIISSTYVLGEFLRTLLQDALVLYNLLQNTEHLFDVETKMAQLLNKRSASRCLLLWVSLHRVGIYERGKLLRTLQSYIEYGLRNRFMFGIQELLDSTACGLARERPQLHGDIYQLRTQCIRQVKECELSEKLTDQFTTIQLLADELHNHAEPALARMGALCGRIVTEPDFARGRNCTWYLGDLIIALELPADALLYTTNRRHFEPLCQLLGKKLYDPALGS